MFTIAKKHDLLYVTFPADATIVSLERDAKAIRNSITQGNRIGTILVDWGGVDKVDTAYLQLLLAILKMADTGQVSIRIGKGNQRLQQILEIYGMADCEPC